MTEQQLRQLVREAIARVGVAPGAVGPAVADRPASIAPSPHSHPSFSLLNLPSGDGPCIIEPAVSCNHCGYCKSYGH